MEPPPEALVSAWAGPLGLDEPHPAARAQTKIEELSRRGGIFIADRTR
jgi:hypothetical protein